MKYHFAGTETYNYAKILLNAKNAISKQGLWTFPGPGDIQALKQLYPDCKDFNTNTFYWVDNGYCTPDNCMIQNSDKDTKWVNTDIPQLVLFIIKDK